MTRPFQIQSIMLPLVCIAAGAIGAVVAWGGSTDERMELVQRLKEFQELPPEQQNNIRKSRSLLKSQPPERQTEIEKIHEESSQNPALKKTLDKYFVWWSSLSPTELETARSLDTAERLEFVKAHWANESKVRKEITVEFFGPANTRLPTLSLTFEEFWGIISAAIPPSERSESLKADLESLTSNKHRALRLTLYVFESFKNQGEPGAMEARGQKFMQSLIANVEDEEWTKRFLATMKNDEGRNYLRRWLPLILFDVLDQATTALGDDLRIQFPVTSDQIVDAFSSLADRTDAEKSLQRSLMTMQADEARKRLELLAQTVGAKTPEQQLLTSYNKSTRERPMLRRAIFGLGNFGPGPGPDRPRGPDDPSRPRREPGRRPPEQK